MLEAIGMIILLSKLLPALIDLVKVIEKQSPGPGHGKEKMVMVLDATEAAYGAATGVNLPKLSEVKTATEKVVSSFVTIFNSDGTFPVGAPGMATTLDNPGGPGMPGHTYHGDGILTINPIKKGV